MHLIFSDHSIPTVITKSIFLAGPSPRAKEVHDWRVDALAYLESIDYDGAVFIPIPEKKFYGEDDSDTWTYDGQIEWECLFRKLADVILFWVPRTKELPGYTTNIEFGEDLITGKVVYGRPDKAEKCRYMDKRMNMHKVAYSTTLQDTIDSAVKKLGEGAKRIDGEVYIPLFVWNSVSFKNWYGQLVSSGNNLKKADVLFNKNGNTGYYILEVDVWSEKEQIYQHEEVVISIHNTFSIVAFYKEEDVKMLLLNNTELNNLGYYSLPSSSVKDEKTMPNILFEKLLNIKCEQKRFEAVTEKKLTSLSSHNHYLFKIELTSNEAHMLNNAQHQFFSLSQMKNLHINFATLGMIYHTLN